ncbi:MAG: hypothetical protein M3Q98_02020 [Actinomycetota bacterium]|nr:hypothetical protein [Actinomycetota bacterium]
MSVALAQRPGEPPRNAPVDPEAQLVDARVELVGRAVRTGIDTVRLERAAAKVRR